MLPADQDKNRIIELVNLYGLAMDTQRWDLFDRIFTEDAELDFVAPSHWHDLASFKRDFAAFHGPFDATQHLMANHLVRVDGDRAQAFTYGNWRLIRRGLEGGDLWEGTGWYDDDLVRSDSGWLITRRTCRVVWWGGNPLVQETSPEIKFAMQSVSLRDESQAGRLRFLHALDAD